MTFFLNTPGEKQACPASFDAKRRGGETPKAFRNKNILTEAVEYRDYLKANPSCTRATIAQHFHTQRERVSKLLSLVRRLPADFVEQAVHYPDTVFVGTDVLDIARIKNRQKQQAAIERLLQTMTHKNF